MTLREINDCLKESESEMETDPFDRLFAIIKILRSVAQREIATDEGTLAGIHQFKQAFGVVTAQNVDMFMELPDEVLDAEIPAVFVWDVLEAD